MSTPDNRLELLRVIALLNAAITNTRLYAADHPQVKRYLERAHLELAQTLRRRPDLTFIIVGDELVLDNRTLKAKTVHLDQFIRLMQENGIERMTFRVGVSRRELDTLVGDLAAVQGRVVRSSANIKLGKVHLKVSDQGDQSSAIITDETKEKLYQLGLLRDRNLDELKALYNRIKTNKKVQIRGVDDIIKAFIEGMMHGVNPLSLLASLKTSDEYTFTHVINVCILTMSQAEALGIDGQQLYQIGIASVLHDAGKLFIPDEILNKPGKLNEDEWEVVRSHTTKGANYIMRLDGISKMAVLGALEHHIRYDGSGYPAVQKNWRPSIVSQMIAIADMFDAMRSRRPYQDPKPQQLIVDVLKSERGTSFHPLLVDNFLRLIKYQTS